VDAEQLRIQALRTGPCCDVRSLIEASTALANRGGHRIYGADALSQINQLAKVTSAKAVHFLLDYSGSMAGSQIRSCIESIKSIFEEHMSGDDHVALTTFNTSVQPKVPWMAKRGHESTIASAIASANHPGGGTSIWDASLCRRFIEDASRSEQYPVDLSVDGRGGQLLPKQCCDGYTANPIND